jgi:magnesium transporter
MSESNHQEPAIQLHTAIADEDARAVSHCLDTLPPSESARTISHLSDEDQARLLTMLPDQEAADLLEAIPAANAVQMIEKLDAGEAAAIFNELDSDEQADLLGRMPDVVAEAVLEQMEPEEAADARRLLQYPADSAGGLMITEYLAYVDNLRVEDVLADLRHNVQKYRQYDVQYVYVVSLEGRLVGVLPLRDIVLADPDERIASLMIPDPLQVAVNTALEDLERLFDHHSLFGVPVVDETGVLVGVVRQQDVQIAAEERSSRTMLRFAGILGGEEFRTMPLRLRSLRRLSWLSINIVLNVIAASVIALYQDTLASVIALAVFLPIISDMSGCSGNQAVAVSMRELALGLVRPWEYLRVLSKEAAVGLINGVILGAFAGAIALCWQGNLALGLVVGVALALNTLVAVCLGGTIPLLLRGIGQDPALASGPILTTITDMCGFFLVLSFASATLPYLTSG